MHAEPSHQFNLELARREIGSCSDLEQLRRAALQLLNLAEMRQQFLATALSQAWFNS